MDPVQQSLCTLTPVQYVASFSAGEVGHLSLIERSIWDCVEIYTIHTFLDLLVGSQLESFLSLIISFLEQLQYNLLPSLIVPSSQVRVGMPLPFYCAVSLAWGQKAYGTIKQFQQCLPVLLGAYPCIFLGETLPTKTFHAKLNGQSAVSMRPYYVTAPIRETGDVIAHLQEPHFFLVHE